MKNLEEKEIKQFSEFEEVTPESDQNLITDKGRFTLGTLYGAIVDYISEFINSAAAEVVSSVQSMLDAAVESATNSSSENAARAEAAANEAEQAAGIRDIRLMKSPIGDLTFGEGGYLNGFLQVEKSDNISIAITTDFDFSVNRTSDVFSIWALGDGSATSYVNEAFYCKFGADDRLRVINNGVANSWNRADIKAKCADGLNTLVFVLKKNGLPDLYVNAQLVSRASSNSYSGYAFSTPGYQFNALATYTNNLISKVKVKMSRLMVFKYDISAVDASYTLEDYQSGLNPDISEDGCVLMLDDKLNGMQVRDLSASVNHALVNGNVSVHAKPALSQSNWKLSWTSGSSTGAYVGFRSSAFALPEYSFNRIFVKGDHAAVFKVGDASNSAAYAAELSVSTDTWNEIEITTSEASALSFTPVSALASATDLHIIIEHRRTK